MRVTTEAYKSVTGKEIISSHNMFEISLKNRTRGHRYWYKLFKKS